MIQYKIFFLALVALRVSPNFVYKAVAYNAWQAKNSPRRALRKCSPKPVPSIEKDTILIHQTTILFASYLLLKIWFSLPSLSSFALATWIWSFIVLVAPEST